MISKNKILYYHYIITLSSSSYEVVTLVFGSNSINDKTLADKSQIERLNLSKGN